MAAIIVLLSLSILIAGGFLLAFIKAVRSGQYEDSYTPSVRILFDDNNIPKKENKTQYKTQEIEI